MDGRQRIGIRFLGLQNTRSYQRVARKMVQRIWLGKASEARKNIVVDQATAIDFMLEVPTSIKRPILETHSGLLIGFSEKEYAAID
jgi:ArsC family